MLSKINFGLVIDERIGIIMHMLEGHHSYLSHILVIDFDGYYSFNTNGGSRTAILWANKDAYG